MRNLKLGGLVIDGAITKNKNGVVEVEASSKVLLWDSILTSGTFLILFGGIGMIIPLQLVLVFEFVPAVAVLIGCMVWLASVLLWRVILKNIRNELVNTLKWTLHG